MRLSRRERNQLREIRREALRKYAAHHSPEETKRHYQTLRYPSGRWSHGGANRSSNIKREIKTRKVQVELCAVCGGVDVETRELTSLFPLCGCQVI